MAGIITYALDKDSGLTAAHKAGVWYHPILLYDEIGKDGNFTKPLRYKIEKTNEQILFHGYTRVSHLTVDQELKKRWRKIIRQVEKGQEPVRLGADILMSIQKYYCLHAQTYTMDGKRIKIRRFIPWPQPQEKVLARAVEMLRTRRDQGRYFLGDCVRLWAPTGNIYTFLFEADPPYDGRGPAIYKLKPLQEGNTIKTYQSDDWA